MLTRQLISSGAYLATFDTLPEAFLWTSERIERSLSETMQARPCAGDVWIFAYGSLIWNPLLNFTERQIATLDGWHRSFCLHMLGGRGNRETPGRMLALEPGGVTQGIALRVPEAAAAEELRLVWTREMVTGAYRPTWAELTMADGSHATALVFVADPARPQYENDAAVASIAPLVAAASGPFGTNADYVFKLQSALADDGLTDAYVEALAVELKRLADVSGT